MLRLQGGQVESLWDEVLPEKLRELPDDLAQMDGLLRDEALLAPIEAQWDREAEARGRSTKGHGRPTMPMQTYVRLMVLKHRYGWGYETLLGEVSDCFHWRRFCLIAIEAEVPDESTVRKLTRRLGAETVAALSRLVIAKAQRERRFRARAVRIAFDRGRGGRALPDRRRPGGGRGADARPGGKAAGGEAGRGAGAGAGSLARGRRGGLGRAGGRGAAGGGRRSRSCSP